MLVINNTEASCDTLEGVCFLWLCKYDDESVAEGLEPNLYYRDMGFYRNPPFM